MRREALSRTRLASAARNRRGMTMIELLVALAIVSIGVFGLAGGATLVTRLTGGGTIQTRAAAIANAHIEQFRSMSCSSVTSGTDTVRSVITTWTSSAITTSARRGTSVSMTVQYPTTKGMRSQVYKTILPC
jgi:prepilin-type N-terminal cleavage/methylation domain-containing protein